MANVSPKRRIPSSPRQPRPSVSAALNRQWHLLFLLDEQPRTIVALSRRLGAGKSTVDRDLWALRALGFPLVDDPDPDHAQRRLWSLSKPLEQCVREHKAATVRALRVKGGAA